MSGTGDSVNRLVYAHKAGDRRGTCIAIHGGPYVDNATAPRDRCIDTRTRHSIIVHRIHVEAAHGPSLLAIERHRFMRINVASEQDLTSAHARSTTRNTEAQCGGMYPKKALARECPAVAAQGWPLDLGRVYAHKLTGFPTHPRHPSKGQCIRDIAERDHSPDDTARDDTSIQHSIDEARHPRHHPIESPISSGSFMRINR